MNAKDFAEAAGGAQRVPGGYLCRCPLPSHGRGKGDRDPSLLVSDGDDAVLFHCFGGCDRTAIFLEAVRQGWIQADEEQEDRRPRQPRAAPIQTVAEEERERSEAALGIWRGAREAVGSLVEVYLQERGITVPPPPSLRFHPRLRHRDTGLELPGLVAAVQGPDRRVQAIQRTFLRQDGRGKAGIRSPKKSLGPLRGGAVRLAAAGDVLVLAEGIESALSLMQMTRHPVWAVLGNCFHNCQPPAGTTTIILAPDHDPGGEAHVDRAAQRFGQEGLRVLHLRPPAGADWNDLLPVYEERAGMREFCGGQERAEAELSAFAETIGGEVRNV